MDAYYKRELNMTTRTLADLMDQIPSELEAHCKADYTSVYSRAKSIFVSRYMEKLPYIGGPKNPHTHQLVFAAAFAAIHDALREHDVPLEQIGQLCLLADERYYARYDKNADARLKKRLTSWFGTQKLKNDVAESTLFISKFSDAWVYKHSTKSSQAKHAISVVNCGVANFYRQQGLTEFLPYLCKIDFRHFENTGLPCRNPSCICKGDDECLFLIDD